MTTIILDFSDLYQRPASRHTIRTGRPVAHYHYRDEIGRLLFKVVRYANPKSFAQWRPHSSGLWIHNLNGTRRVLYRLPELLAADRFQWVFLCEGEKDADNTAAHGLVATTAPMGAGKWRDEYAEFLRGRRVAIVPDNDQAGREHAAQIAASLEGIAAFVRVIKLVGVAEHGDVSDWFDAGGAAATLLGVLRESMR